MKKLKPIEGWIEDEKDKIEPNTPEKCPRCGGPVWKVNALSVCGVLLVGCKDATCRWGEEFTE